MPIANILVENKLMLMGHIVIFWFYKTLEP